MNEVTMATIIKNLSDELCATVKRLHDAEDRCKATQSNATHWFNECNKLKQELEFLKGSSRLDKELPDMEELN